MVKKEKAKYLRTARYGRKIRLRYDVSIKKQKEKYECLQCGKKKVKRIGYALFECKSCNRVSAGGAYMLETAEGATIRKLSLGLK